MATHEVSSCVRGFHVYSDIWTPFVGETLVCEQESGNPNDPYAVAIKKGSEVVGHVPRKSSAACSLFLLLGGTICCEITDNQRRYSSDLPQVGMEVPCKFIFQGDTKCVAKVRKLIQSVPPVNVNRDRSKPVNTLKRSLEEECHDSAPIKKPHAAIDLDSLVMCNDGSEERIWLTFGRQTLTGMDKLIIVKGQMLTDKHINFAQSILKHQFNNVSGLQSTLIVHRAKRMSSFNASRMLQVLHCRGCHWIAISTIENFPQVMVYDSSFSFVDQTTQKLLKQLLGTKIDIRVGGQKQEGSVDCGLFAIATCVSLAAGGELHRFIQAKMRDHLFQCFEKMNFTIFPGNAE